MQNLKQNKTFNGLKSGVNFTMSNNKLAIYSAEDKPFVIIIENKNIVNALKDYFVKNMGLRQLK